jgi:Zn-dependent metalloprotease
MRLRKVLLILTVFMLAAALLASSAIFPGQHTTAAPAAPATGFKMYARPAPNFDLNLSRNLGALRRATDAQLAAVEALKANSQAPNMTVRWNDFGGSPDVLMDFASAPLAGTPEEAGRSFLAANAAAFGISSVSDLRLVSDVSALGGHLLRFQQTYGGIDVKDGGVGLVLNKDNQVVMASGPFFRDVNVGTTPTLTAQQATQAASADLARFSVKVPDYINNLLKTGRRS